MIAILRILKLKQDPFPGNSKRWEHVLPPLLYYAAVTDTLRCFISLKSAGVGDGLGTGGNRFAGEPMLDFFGHSSRGNDRLRGAGNGSLGVGIRKEDAVHWLTKQWLHLGEDSRHSHIHGMSSPIQVHFDRIDIEGREKFLEIPQDISGHSASGWLGKQQATVFFVQGGIAAEDVVLRVKAGLIANHPVSHA